MMVQKMSGGKHPDIVKGDQVAVRRLRCSERHRICELNSTHLSQVRTNLGPLYAALSPACTERKRSPRMLFSNILNLACVQGGASLVFYIKIKRLFDVVFKLYLNC